MVGASALFTSLAPSPSLSKENSETTSIGNSPLWLILSSAPLKLKALLKRIARAKVLPVDMDASTLPACEGAWKGRCLKEGVRCITLEEAQALGLKVIEWDGR